MIKNFFFCITLLLSLISCSNDLESFDDEANLPSLRAIPHQHYKELGWGIDITGDYLSLNAITAPVIDVNKFENDFSTRIVAKPNQRYAYNNTYYGNTSKEYIKSIDVSLNADFGNKPEEKNNEKFPHTISGNFFKKQSYASNYTFVGQDECVDVGKAYFVEKDPIVLQKYLDAGFIYSLNTKSAETVVKEYGTHVLLDVVLGGKLSMLYRSEVVKTTKEITAKAGFAVSVLKTFGLSGEGNSNLNLVANNTNAYLHAKSSGGAKSISVSWDFNNGSLKTASAQEWSNSVDYPNSVVMKVQKAIPLYELVSNPKKKAQIKEAIEKYITERELELVIPLHRWWHAGNKNTLYSNLDKDVFPSTNWTYEGIQCYVYSYQYPGTVALHRWWHKGNKNTLLSTLPKGEFPSTNWAYEGILGYIFSTQVPGSVPLHRWWHAGNKNTLCTTLSKSEFPSTNWRYEGILGYVFPADNEIGK